MISTLKTSNRKRVNLMMDTKLLKKIDQEQGAGKRSDFVNEAIREKLTLSSRQNAFTMMDKFKQEHKIKTTQSEIHKLKEYGRK